MTTGSTTSVSAIGAIAQTTVRAQPQAPPVKPVESTSSSSGGRVHAETQSTSPGLAHLTRSARHFVALLELTGDPNVAALFSGFDAPRGVDTYG